MDVLSVFSGIGGFDLGFERAEMNIVSSCDNDASCRGILSRHFPGSKIYDDVRKIGNKTHGRNSVDVIVGGFPCQDLSIAGKRKGLAGERSGLWFEFARVIDELEPGWFVIENVPGLLSSDEGKDFAIILRWLAERGYGVCWRVLDSQYFGVAQRRRRVFIVGSFGNGSSAQVLFESEGGAGNIEAGREAWDSTAGTFTIRSGKNGGGKGFLGVDELSFPVGPQGVYLQRTDGALQARDAKGIGSTIDDKIVSFSHRNSSSRSMTIHDNQSPTLESQDTSVSIQNDMGVRRLTPTECERLQGFPDGWTDGQSDSARYRQLGNAVTVSVIEWLAKRIKKL